MKSLILVLAFSLFITACHQDEPEERAATIVALEMSGPGGFCICCYGYRLRMGTQDYYADVVPAPYDKANTPVWIRYMPDSDRCRESTDRIVIKTIRSR